MRTFRLIVGALLVASGGFTVSEGATFTVNSAVDAVDAAPGNGICATTGPGQPCSLRAAIQEANARPGTDTITLPAGIYTFGIAGAGEDAGATGDLDVTETLTINGQAAATTIIDGNALDRVIDVPNLTTNLTINDVTIRHGANGLGAGISVGGTSSVPAGTLILSRCVVTDNDATINEGGGLQGGFGGGIWIAQGTLVLASSTVSSNRIGTTGLGGGGGVYAARFVIDGSTISGNTGQGLVIDTPAGPTTSSLTNSSVSSNVGRGIVLRAAGANAANVWTFANVTVSNNLAEGMFLDLDLAPSCLTPACSATLNLNNVTAVDNAFSGLSLAFQSPGPNQMARVNASNSILDCDTNVNNALMGQGYNLFPSLAACQLDPASDLTGNVVAAPGLGSLQNNGGPTFTKLPGGSSPAVNAGRPGAGTYGCAATDQRGVARPVGARCDIGAVETTVCGDGVPSPPIEQCDLGAANGSPNNCCVGCALRASGIPCTDDGNTCTRDECDGAQATCQHPSRFDGSTCDDATVCNGRESCLAGICRSSPPLDCNDLNSCTTDACNPVSGCGHTFLPNGAPCDDATLCNGRESCQGGACQPGQPLDCADTGGGCTADTCSPTLGCQHTPIAGCTTGIDGLVGGPSGQCPTPPDASNNCVLQVANTTLKIPLGGPPYALPTATNITIAALNQCGNTYFALQNDLAANVRMVSCVEFFPNNQPFGKPITMTFGWANTGGTCAVSTPQGTVNEGNLRIYRSVDTGGGFNGTFITERFGNGAGCPNTTVTTPCPVSGACSQAICDPTSNLVTLTGVPHFSEYAFVSTPCDRIGDAKLTLHKIGAPPGDDSLAFKGTLTLPSGVSFGQLLPDQNGLQLTLEDLVPGAPIPVDHVDLPTLVYYGDPLSPRFGWKSAQTKHTWVDKRVSPPGGIVQVTLKDRSKKSPGLVALGVKGKKGSFAMSAGGASLQVTLPGTDLCYAANFPGPGSKQVCELSGGAGNNLKCRWVGTTTTSISTTSTTSTSSTTTTAPASLCCNGIVSGLPVCFDSEPVQAAARCAAEGGTLAPAGVFCDGAGSGTCAGPKSFFGCCETPGGLCFESGSFSMPAVCSGLGGTTSTNATCDPSTHLCGAP